MTSREEGWPPPPLARELLVGVLLLLEEGLVSYWETWTMRFRRSWITFLTDSVGGGRGVSQKMSWMGGGNGEGKRRTLRLLVGGGYGRHCELVVCE